MEWVRVYKGSRKRLVNVLQLKNSLLYLLSFSCAFICYCAFIEIASHTLISFILPNISNTMPDCFEFSNILSTKGSAQIFIPWKTTSAGLKALKAIIKFSSWVSHNSPIRSFIDTHCIHLLKSEQKNKNKTKNKNWGVVSIDTLENNFVRFHDNPNAARIELSALVGITSLKPSRNFTKDYITGALRKGVRSEPIKFRRRFKLQWRAMPQYIPNIKNEEENPT